MKTFRIYGKTLNTWFIEDEKGREILRQVEIAYKEYNECGELIGAGSEDFSRERYNREIVHKQVFSWNGEKRNKGGKRWFDDLGFVTIIKSDSKIAKEYLTNLHGSTLLQLR
ncbi:hypothetical protein [Hungatella hathewayi]|uniref:hypothetical protein n=1 Tax=Hungatella hathewayi TaxID=154046 RepID=UPI0035647C44